MDVNKIIRILNKKYRVKQWREAPFKVLITTILSQRTKDEVTRVASKKLLSVADSPRKILKLTEQQIERLIYPVGFYRKKAKKIRRLCRLLLERHKGRVPSSREELLRLPGVGNKTASCVLCFGYEIPTVVVDTHCNRISQRLGLVPKNSTPEKTREILEKSVSDDLKFILNFLFIQFGKGICKPINPICNTCSVKKYCKYFKSLKKSANDK